MANLPSQRRAAGVLAAVLVALGAIAQTPPPPPTANPLTALMHAQPNIDTASPVVAQAVFDPPVIRPGETATYRVTFNAMQASIQWPEDVIAPDELQLTSAARGQVFRPGPNNNLLPQTSFNYRARPTTNGTFTVPRYLVYVGGVGVTVPPAELMVTADAPATPRTALTVSVNPTNPYVGQLVTARVILPGAEDGVLRTLTGVELTGEGFLTDLNSARQQVSMMPRNGRDVPAFIYEAALTPLRPGRVRLAAQGHTAGLQFSGPITITGRVTIPGGAGQFTLLDADPVTLQVRPLPRGGELPGFTGAVGRFEIETPTLSANVVQVGEPLTLTVQVRGEGHLARLVPPPPPRLREWQVFAARPEATPPQIIAVRGFAQFQYTLIPNTDTVKATPVVPFSYFDPERGEYVALNIPAVPVTVQPGAEALAAALAARDAAEEEGPPAPRLTDLATNPGRSQASLVPHQAQAWFPFVATAPLLLFLAGAWWDRHRRFHEAHPEVRVRRRARRALRREWAAWRRAAGLGDTGRFAAHAVNALRAGCAPHYPAEPAALVGRDVLPLLPEPERAGDEGRAVREIFAAVDATRFARETRTNGELLALREPLERVMTRLEKRLREGT
jgi:hypothetical protein